MRFPRTALMLGLAAAFTIVSVRGVHAQPTAPAKGAAPPPLPTRPKESAEWTPRPRDSSRRKKGS